MADLASTDALVLGRVTYEGRWRDQADSLPSSGWKAASSLFERVDIEHIGQKIRGVEYIGYDDSNKNLKSSFFSNGGAWPFRGSFSALYLGTRARQ